MPTKLRFHVMRRYAPGLVRAAWAADSRARVAEVDAAIESAWRDAVGRKGINLFDGPMCRLERFAAGDELSLEFSVTSYKIFLGTNLAHPEFADRFGTAAMANPVGLSTALESSDGFVLLGRRNSSVAYYPNRVHPFAGALEPGETQARGEKNGVDVFAQVHRELAEELNFLPGDIGQTVCLGIVEDISLRQPEMIFHTLSTRTRKEIEARLDEAEHSAVVALRFLPDELGAMIADAELTPVGAAALLLLGREKWGIGWFDEASRVVTLVAP